MMLSLFRRDKKVIVLRFSILNIITLVSILIVIFFVLNYLQAVNFGNFFKENLPVRKDDSYTYSEYKKNEPAIKDFLDFSQALKSGNVNHALLNLKYSGTVNKIDIGKGRMHEHLLDLAVHKNLFKLLISKDAESAILDSTPNGEREIKLEDLRPGDTILIDYEVDLLDKNLIKKYKILRTSSKFVN